jgi:hypothetical protein
LRFKRQCLTEFDLAARQVGADETLTVLLAEIQQIVAAGALLVGLRRSYQISDRSFRTGGVRGENQDNDPPSWPGRYMGGGAWWRTIKRILIMP